jgi:hypothetical protein
VKLEKNYKMNNKQLTKYILKNINEAVELRLKFREKKDEVKGMKKIKLEAMKAIRFDTEGKPYEIRQSQCYLGMQALEINMTKGNLQELNVIMKFIEETYHLPPEYLIYKVEILIGAEEWREGGNGP